MVRQLAFVVVAGSIGLFGLVAAIDEAGSQTATTNGTDAILTTVDAVAPGVSALLVGLVGLMAAAGLAGLR